MTLIREMKAGSYRLPNVTPETSAHRPFALRTLHDKLLLWSVEVVYVKHEMWLHRLKSGRAMPAASIHQHILVRINFLFVQSNPVLAQVTLIFLSGSSVIACTSSQQ